MIRLEKLEVTKRGNYLLRFDNGVVEKTTAETVSDNNLYNGMEFSDEDYEELIAAVTLSRTKTRAGYMLSRRALSRKELVKKLQEKGESQEDSETVADLMVKYGLINDSQYAHEIVRRLSAKGYGPSRIKQEFYQKGIDRDFWDEALQSQRDMSDEIYSYIEKRLDDPGDRKHVKKVTDALARKGHSWDDISSALRRYKENIQEQEDYESDD